MTEAARLMVVVRLGPADWRAFRAIRLAALAEAPAAFGSTLAAERRLRPAAWRARLAGRAQFAVRCGEALVGTVGGFADAASGGAELVSMWVQPAWRGQGVGDLLVRAVVDWARAAGYPAVRLWVSADNGPAERLYARHGFCRTGERQLIDAEAPERGDEVAMLRPLSTAAEPYAHGLSAAAEPRGHDACSQPARTP